MHSETIDPILVLRCKWAARCCAIAVAALGVSVLIGWVLDVATLKSVLPEPVEMKANTALGFVLAAMALLAAGHGKAEPTWSSTQFASATLVALLGLLTLGEYGFGTDFGIDQLLFADPADNNSIAPHGRMAGATAVGFTLTGLALLLLDSRRYRGVAQAGALLGSLIGVLALLGYCYDVPALHGFGAYSSVALHTAIGLIVINVGVLLARPQSGLMAVVNDQAVGGIMARRLLPFAVTAPFLIGWLSVHAEQRGAISSAYGVALVQLVYITLFSTLIWRTAAKLRHVDYSRSASEREQRRQQAKLAGIIDSAMDAIIMVDDAHRIVEFNPAAALMFGRGAADILGGPLDLLLPQQFRAAHPAHLRAFRATGSTGRRMGGVGIITGVRANGDEFPIEASISQLEADGERFFTVILRDITESRRVQDALRDSEEKFRAMANAMPQLAWIARPDGHIFWYNSRWYEYTGTMPEEMEGWGWQSVHDTVELPKVIERWQASIATGRPFEMTYPLRGADGRFRRFLTRVDPLKDAAGRVLQWFGTSTDVEELTRTEEALRVREGQFRAFFNTAAVGAAEFSLDGHILVVNERLCQITGYNADELSRMARGDLMHPDDRTAGSELLVDYLRGDRPQYQAEKRYIRKDGQVIWVQINASLIRDASGNALRSAVLIQDISARKRAEEALRAAHDASMLRDWQKTGLMQLSEAMVGDPDSETLAAKVISEICTYLDAQVGAMYLVAAEDSTSLRMMGSYAYPRGTDSVNEFRLGEGLVGQAALDNQQLLIKDVPADYVRVSSAIGERVPRSVCVTPFSYNGHLKGVIEIGTLHDLSDAQMAYLQQAMPALAAGVESAYRRSELAWALQQSQRLSEELQVQQEELRVANEELTEQTQRLQVSEARLMTQQEELQVVNEELEEKNESLARQKREVELARNDLTAKAEALARASKYKSEFLANMSHELRTPLNSLLLLAQGLARNKEGNLSADQVECAQVIYNSGSDLHHLINEILDLSKIEAGQMNVEFAPVRVNDLADGVRASFAHMAEDKGLGFHVVVSDVAPAEIASDRKRIEQILRNLVGNAIKFTDQGSVTVTFGRPTAATELARCGLAVDACLAVAVSDTGIGIATDKHQSIFEAFQQAETGTSRQYGGTGLGLTISRELATLLGGEIQLASQPGQGATFILYLPISRAARAELPAGNVRRERQDAVRLPPPASGQVAASQDSAYAGLPPYIADDRDALAAEDKLILVIEDDPKFATILASKCRERGFKHLAAPSGEAGLELALRYLPSAVILDLRLPGIDGLAVLAKLKEDTRTRHIPVHVVSVQEKSIDLLRQGAVGHAVKPLDHDRLDALFRRLEQVALIQPKRLLVVEDDPQVRHEIMRLIGSGDIVVDEAASGDEAMQALRRGGYDCVVVDLKLPDMDGRTMLERLEREGVALPPVIVHTARELTADEERGLREHTESIVIKDVRSPERLLDEVSLFLHRVVSRMPEQQRQIIRSLHDSDAVLQGKTVLIVEDDMRTLFALTRLLRERGLSPLQAENGERALQLLAEQANVDLVLMDIMMPVMDGYETMRRIRAQAQFRKLPIITLTAKGMPEDRQKCLEAGANDYLTKPIDADRLFSMMRIWLYG